MNTIGLIIKAIFQFIIFCWIVRLIGGIFFKKMLLGKLIAVIFKDTWLFFKLTYRMFRNTLRYCFKTCKTINNKLNKKLQDKNKTNTEKKENKVVNGNNIIDFKTAKDLRYKWNK